MCGAAEGGSHSFMRTWPLVSCLCSSGLLNIYAHMRAWIEFKGLIILPLKEDTELERWQVEGGNDG